MRFNCATLFLFLFYLACSNNSALIEAKFFSAAIARERLVTDLFVNYNNMVRPALKNETIVVHLNIILQHFDYHEKDGAFNLVGAMNARWRDTKLAWNPKDYNNLTRIPVSQRAIWVPDLEVYNNAPDKFLRMHRNGVVVLSHNGDVLWSDNIDITIFCTTNMVDWPHDQHVCKMSLGSWTYDGYDLDIHSENLNETMSFDEIDMKSMEYQIVKYRAEHVATEYACCEEPYISIDYHITFARRAAYVVIFRVPMFCVILLTLLALAMEPTRSEKLLLNGISFIIIVFHLIYFASNVGRFARGTPLIVTFYSNSMILVTIAQLVCVFSLLATRARYNGKLPWRVSNFLKSPIARLISPAQQSYLRHEPLEQQAQFENVTLHEFSSLLCGDATPNEWMQLAIIVERAALIVCAFIYLILCSVCFV